MINEFKQLLSEFGVTVRLQDSEGYNSSYFKCFIQPLRYKNKMYLDGVNTAIGFNSEGHYLYIGPPEHDLTQVGFSDVWLSSSDEKYKIDRAEKVCKGSDVFYIWAIIRKMVEVDQ